MIPSRPSALLAIALSVSLLLIRGSMSEPLAHREALFEFYFATGENGGWATGCTAGWNNLRRTDPPPSSFCDSWNSLIDYSTFSGVVCSGWNGNILRLKLDSCNLCGTLPVSLSRVTTLKWIQLPFNRLYGTLPKQYASLVDLMNLDLDGNDLSGALPASWPAAMQKLETTHYCIVRCSGTLGNVQCVYSGAIACVGINLAYNCFNQALLPPINPSWSWNWNSTKLQSWNSRTNCRRWVPSPSLSASFTALHSESHSFSLSEDLGSASVTSSKISTMIETASSPSTVTLSWSGTVERTASSSHHQPVSGSSSLSLTVSDTNSHSIIASSNTVTSSKHSATIERTSSPSTVSLSRSGPVEHTAAFPSPSPIASGSSSLSLTSSVSPTESTSIDLVLVKHTNTKESRHTAPLSHLQATREISTTVTLGVPDVVVVVAPSFASSLAVATSAATVGTVAAVSSLVSVDPGGASVQAILTFLACRSRAPAFGGTFQSWLATLPISPFLPLGLPAAALGNIALATGVTVIHTMAVVYAASRISHSSSADLSFRTRCYQQAAVLRFPSWSLVVWEFLLCGIAVCGTSLASNGDGIYSSSDVVIGWISVTVVGLVLVIWLWITRRVTARVSCSIDSVPSSTSVSSIGCTTPASHLLLPRLHSILRPRALWGPVDMVQQYSSLFDATRGRTSIPWRRSPRSPSSPRSLAQAASLVEAVFWPRRSVRRCCLRRRFVSRWYVRLRRSQTMS